MRIHILVALDAPVLRSCHYFGRLLQSEVQEPTPAPTELGRLRLYTKICNFELS